MAMTLQPSRLRITQAIYFGHQPGFGVTTINSGNGITAVPNPIITTGHLDLGTLTSDWQAGNFNINSRNSISVFNVVAYGADATGAADSVAGFTAAISACQAAGGGVVYIPPGTFKITQVGAAVPLVVTGGNVSILGAGRTVSNINFIPATGGACIQFNTSGVPINYNRVADFSFRSPDSATQKTMILARDLNNFIVERISNTAGTFWTGASSIGVQFMGRQEMRMRDCEITADFPVRISVNPNSVVSFDHSSVEDSDFIVTNPLTNASVTVDDGVLLTNSSFKRLACVQGMGAIFYNNTTLVTACQSVVIDDIRTEQSKGTTGFDIDLRSSVSSIQGLVIRSAVLAGLTHGIRLTGAKWPLIDSLSYPGGGGRTALDLSATVTGLCIRNSFIQTGATITDLSAGPAAINLVIGGNPAYSSFGTLTAVATVPLTATPTAMFGGTANNSGSTVDVFRDSTYSTEGTDGVYIRTGNSATNAGLRIGTDKTNNTAFIQSMEPGTSYTTKPLAIQPVGGFAGFGTLGATRQIDLNGTQRWRGIAAPAISEANSGTIYFDSSSNKFKASLNGSAYVDIIGSGGLTGSGAANKLTYWDGVTSVAAPAAIYVDPVNNRIGLNVVTPAYSLDVDGDINITTNHVFRYNAGQVFAVAAAGWTAVGLTIGTLASGDCAVGAAAMANSTGAGTGVNTAIGANSLQLLTTGNHNTSVGAAAMSATTTGANNVALGDAAGGTNTIGTKNIFIGSTADATANNLDRAGAIGYGATIAVSNGLNIGGGFTKVGLFTNTPQAGLDVNGTVAVRHIDLTLANGLNSNITPLTSASYLRVTGPSAGFSLGGFTMGAPGNVNGLFLYIFNSTTQQMTIVNEDASSTATSRIKTLTGGNVVLRAGTSAATFRYCDVEDRWILFSSN